MTAATGIATKKICIVDDDPAICDSLLMLLKARGYQVEAYRSAAEFLRAHDDSGACGCLVLDHHMPMMSGIDLLNDLRSRKVATPAIMMTGRGDQTVVERARQAGALVVLDKPLARADLLKWVDHALASAPQG